MHKHNDVYGGIYYTYPGRIFYYTCTTNDGKNQIIVKVDKIIRGIQEFVSTIRESALSKQDLPLVMQSSSTTISQDLSLLAREKYIPQFIRSKRTCVFRKIGVESFLTNNFLVRSALNMHEIVVMACCGQASHRDLLKKIFSFDSKILVSLRLADSPPPKDLPPAQVLLEECPSSDCSAPDDLPPAFVEGLISGTKIAEDPVPEHEFPVGSLETFLKVLNDLEVDKLLIELQERVKNHKETILTPILQALGMDTSSGPGALLSANLSPATKWELLKKGFSKIDLLDLIGLCRKDFKEAGEIGKIILAAEEIRNYFAKFAPLPEQKLEMQRLLYSLLIDKKFHVYLQDEEVIEQLAKLVVSLKIPYVDDTKIKDMIKLIGKLHKVACPIIKTHALDNYFILYVYLANHIKDYADLGCQALQLAADFKSLIDEFMVPSPLPIQFLLTAQDKPAKTYPPGGTFFDCAELFTNYKDPGNLGLYVSLAINPIQKLINSKNLNNFVFIANQENVALSTFNKKMTIFANFDGCAFENFSFRNTHFINFHFKNVYFKDCDFTNASFAGKTKFEKVYMDGKSAQGFLKGLSDSKKQPHYHLEMTGDNGLVNLYDHTDVPLTVDKDFAEAVLNPETPTPACEQKSEKQPETQGFLSNLVQAIGTLGSSIKEKASEAAETLHSTFDYYADRNPGENNREDYIQCKKIEPELMKVKEELNEKIAQLKEQLTLMANGNSSGFKDLEAKITQNEGIVEILNQCIQDISRAHNEKKKIHAEQVGLLKHQNPQMKLFYETFLTGLCAFLNSVTLMNNEYVSLIPCSTGKAVNLSNKVSKKSMGAEKKEGKLEMLERRLKNGVDRLLEPLELVIPVLKCIEQVPGLIPGAMEKVIQFSDRDKLKKTVAIFRGLTPKKLEKLADQMARIISLSFEEQIVRLSNKGAIRFAQSGVECIAGALLSGLIPENVDLVSYAWLSLRQLRQYHNKTVLTVNILFTTESLPGKEPNTSFTADELYRCSGLKYREKERWFEHLQTHYDPKKFGHCQIHDETLKQHIIPSHKPSKSPSPKIEKASLGVATPEQAVHRLEATIIALELEWKRAENEERLRRDEHTLIMETLKAKVDAVKLEQDKLKEIYSRSVKGETVSAPETQTSAQTQAVPSPIVTNGLSPEKPPVVSAKKSVSIPSSSSTVKIPPRIPFKLININNSCYMNAVLQVFFNLPPVLTALENYTPTKGQEKKTAVIGTLKKLIQSNGHIDHLKNLREAFFDYSEWDASEKMRQHDAQEFLLIMLNLLDFQKIKVGEEAISRDPGNDSRKPIRSCFESMLSVALGKPSFQEMLNANFAPGDQDNTPLKTSDEKGILFTKWQKRSFMENAPDYLFVQLKRFMYQKQQEGPKESIEKMNGPDLNVKKLHTPIVFPNDGVVTLSIEGQKDPINYQIISYINHQGPLPHQGHYIAYVKSAIDNMWYECDDTKYVGTVMGPKNTHSQAYILVLKKTCG